MLKILSQSSFVTKRLNKVKNHKRYENRKHLEDNISYKNINSNKIINNIKNDKDYSYILDFIESTSKQNSSKKKSNIEKLENNMNNNPILQNRTNINEKYAKIYNKNDFIINNKEINKSVNINTNNHKQNKFEETKEKELNNNSKIKLISNNDINKINNKNEENVNNNTVSLK